MPVNDPRRLVRLRRMAKQALRRVVVVAAVFVAMPALAQPWQVAAVSPPAPTWHDPVTVRIEGSVPGGCGASVGSPAFTHFGAEQHRVDLPIFFDCVIPTGTSSAFVADVPLGVLDPGHYQVRLRSESETLAELRFDVFEVLQAQLTLPALATTAAPGSLRLTVSASSMPSASVVVFDHRVEVTLDRPTGVTPELFDLDVPLPAFAAGDYEVRVLSPRANQVPGLARGSLRVWDAQRCLPDDETLCLHAGRFRLSATWRDFAGGTGVAHPRPLPGNEGSGLLWFFGPDNTELTVKVLDACAISGRWWTFVSSSSTVEYTLTVTDTATGVTRSYRNPLGEVPRLIADTDAFGCP